MIDPNDGSAIVAYRSRVIEAIRAQVAELNEVDWYDGLFDEDDVREWGRGAPNCYVAVLNVPSDHHSTGEINGDVRVVAVVLTQDTDEPRSHDAQNWRLIQQIAILANLNKFGDPNAGAATNLSFQRLRHPELRREGVGIGVVEWSTVLTFGTNTFDEADKLRDEDGEFIPMPPDVEARMAAFLGDYSEIEMLSEEPTSP